MHARRLQACYIVTYYIDRKFWCKGNLFWHKNSYRLMVLAFVSLLLKIQMNYVHLNGFREYNGMEDTSRFTQTYKVSLS